MFMSNDLKQEQQDANVTMDSYEDGQVDVDETNGMCERRACTPIRV